MRAALACPAFVLILSSSILAQAPPANAAHSYTSELGFRYEVPRDWEVVTAQVNMPQTKDQAAQNATSEQEKRGFACAQMGMTSRHASSVIVDVSLPFDCFGQKLSEADLADFGNGASQGLKQSFDVGEPVYGSYTLGTHKLWIERVHGTPKGQATTPYTIEIACAVLTKAAVCWMGLAADDAALHVFEGTHLTLDGETAAALVPANAFQSADTVKPGPH